MPGDVNAGTYLFDPAVLREWTPDRAISIEREIFPAVIAAGHAVYGFPGNCYWMDLGTPEKYLQAHFDLLAGQMRGVEYEAPWVAADGGHRAGSDHRAPQQRRRRGARRPRRHGRGQRDPPGRLDRARRHRPR